MDKNEVVLNVQIMDNVEVNKTEESSDSLQMKRNSKHKRKKYINTP